MSQSSKSLSTFSASSPNKSNPRRHTSLYTTEKIVKFDKKACLIPHTSLTWFHQISDLFGPLKEAHRGIHFEAGPWFLPHLGYMLFLKVGPKLGNWGKIILKRDKLIVYIVVFNLCKMAFFDN